MNAATENFEVWGGDETFFCTEGVHGARFQTEKSAQEVQFRSAKGLKIMKKQESTYFDSKILTFTNISYTSNFSTLDSFFR
jgi:hypothetical protein